MGSYHFRQTVWGYHKKDVDSYLAELKLQLQKRSDMIEDLRQKLRNAEYENEDLLNTLLVYQKINETLKMSIDRNSQEPERMPGAVYQKECCMDLTVGETATVEDFRKTESNHEKSDYTKNFNAG